MEINCWIHDSIWTKPKTQKMHVASGLILLLQTFCRFLAYEWWIKLYNEKPLQGYILIVFPYAFEDILGKYYKLILLPYQTLSEAVSSRGWL